MKSRIPRKKNEKVKIEKNNWNNNNNHNKEN